MTKLADILIGSAHIPAHADGGWALPGGGRTTDESAARTFASTLSKIIGPTAPVRSLNPPVILTRKRTQSR